MQARNLFDYIDLAFYVEAPAGDGHAEFGVLLAFRNQDESETLQQTINLAGIQIAAENAVHLGNAQQDGGQIQGPRDHVDGIADQFAAAGVQNHFRHQIAGENGGFEIRAAFEAVRSVGVQAVAARHLADNSWVPPCGLDHDVAGLVGDHRLVSAHDSGEAYGLLRVADDEIFFRELAFDSVESLECLSVASEAHDDLSALEQVGVEDVGGLADLPENVVGRIDGVRDRALIEKLQTVRDFLRR